MMRVISVSDQMQRVITMGIELANHLVHNWMRTGQSSVKDKSVHDVSRLPILRRQ